MYSTTAREPTPVETNLIDVAARMAGLAIERKRAEDRIHHMARHDALTGLPNRAVLNERLSQALLYADRDLAMNGQVGMFTLAGRHVSLSGVILFLYGPLVDAPHLWATIARTYTDRDEWAQRRRICRRRRGIGSRHPHVHVDHHSRRRRDARDQVIVHLLLPQQLAVLRVGHLQLILQELRQDLPRLRDTVGELRELCDRYGFAYYREWALVLDGWSRTDGSGINLARQGIGNLRSEGAFARMPY